MFSFQTVPHVRLFPCGGRESLVNVVTGRSTSSTESPSTSNNAKAGGAAPGQRSQDQISDARHLFLKKPRSRTYRRTKKLYKSGKCVKRLRGRTINIEHFSVCKQSQCLQADLFLSVTRSWTNKLPFGVKLTVNYPHINIFIHFIVNAFLCMFH